MAEPVYYWTSEKYLTRYKVPITFWNDNKPFNYKGKTIKRTNKRYIPMILIDSGPEDNTGNTLFNSSITPEMIASKVERLSKLVPPNSALQFWCTNNTDITTLCNYYDTEKRESFLAKMSAMAIAAKKFGFSSIFMDAEDYNSSQGTGLQNPENAWLINKPPIALAVDLCRIFKGMEQGFFCHSFDLLHLRNLRSFTSTWAQYYAIQERKRLYYLSETWNNIAVPEIQRFLTSSKVRFIPGFKAKHLPYKGPHWIFDLEGDSQTLLESI